MTAIHTSVRDLQEANKRLDGMLSHALDLAQVSSTQSAPSGLFPQTASTAELPVKSLSA